MCVCVHVHHWVQLEVGGQLAESYNVGHKTRPQILRLGSTFLYPLNHLTSLMPFSGAEVLNVLVLSFKFYFLSLSGF